MKYSYLENRRTIEFSHRIKQSKICKLTFEKLEKPHYKLLIFLNGDYRGFPYCLAEKYARKEIEKSCIE
jgi:hypothetical protein